ncbi:MAG: hypothetical protein CVU64_00810 [Deltaproteobacteria bacterium HGW-Deltaproteobacteria-21]|nr:MAG: hypothetical protein CVU64_00810 [Deltaproteobacteria bacterium HGW-Deltaproteobacteria-21]
MIGEVIKFGAKDEPTGVSICVLTFNRMSELEATLCELSSLEYRPLELIVVDNHSSDGTESLMRDRFPAVKYIRSPRNIGAAARNLGLRGASYEYVITLDDDVRGIRDRDIDRILDQFQQHPRWGAINFRVVNAKGELCNWIHHCREEENQNRQFFTYEITEGAVAFRKSVLDSAGYYPQSFFLSHEGPDLAFRIFASGYAVVYWGEVTVTHHFSAQGRTPWRNYYYDTRNQLWLAARNLPPAYAATYLGRGLLSMLCYSIRDGYLRFWIKGLTDGLTGFADSLRERRVLDRTTMGIIRAIDRKRPGIWYMLRKRVIGRRGLLFE